MITSSVAPVMAQGTAEGAAELVMLEELEHDALGERLHDGPVQDLLAVRYLTDIASSALVRGDLGVVGARLEELRGAAQQAQSETAQAMRALRARCVDGLGLVEAIEGHAATTHSAGGPSTVVQGSIDVALRPVVAVAMHRVAQAALWEARRRGASHARIALELTPGVLRLVMTDDGPLADPEPSVATSTLARWGRRVGRLGGCLQLSTVSGHQQVSCSLPTDPVALGGLA
jgi:signal transduction histidine kinase